MRLQHHRAGRAALVLAAALAATALPPIARAEEGRVYTVQSEADLKKRAELVLEALKAGGAKISYGAVEKGAGESGVVIKALEITTPDNKKLTIEQLEIRKFDWDNPKQPMAVDLSIRKLVVPPESLGKETADLGLTSLTINADFDYAFDDAKKSFEIAGIFVDIAELGELRLKLKLVGLSLAELQKATSGDKAPGDKKEADAGMKLLAKVNITGASLSFKDKSLVERLIRADAKKKNLTEAAAKAKLLEDLAEQRKKAEDDATRELLDVAAKFLTQPGTIEVVANPAQPANVMMAFMAIVSSPATLKQMLGITVAVK
jgi:hypothetical protein